MMETRKGMRGEDQRGKGQTWSSNLKRVGWLVGSRGCVRQSEMPVSLLQRTMGLRHSTICLFPLGMLLPPSPSLSLFSPSTPVQYLRDESLNFFAFSFSFPFSSSPLSPSHSNPTFGAKICHFRGGCGGGGGEEAEVGAHDMHIPSRENQPGRLNLELQPMGSSGRTQNIFSTSSSLPLIGVLSATHGRLDLHSPIHSLTHLLHSLSLYSPLSLSYSLVALSQMNRYS
ncbi:uncharacterized protein BO72DRAFT_163101 [Aspergillus fijiensis CBS 313.89]|uniref:Uncharacterized protein n=1 Tax=Aspergillus fijiensis CBS 313.89 TaxID=1448319 RepID=A0A8G1RRY3_9EURO|nr:uncharacterized protein BO72DRAFT_163101 [Aspergillus fijiensis CBS 313.89]RAK75621.1 hypothetical protein BO72DRAFT_163101 [Aspergillus fijiensis CBS 313.89]